MPISPCRLLPWDTRFFGFPIGRLDSPRLRLADLATIEDWCGIHRIECLYLLADCSCPETLESACEARFKFVDMRYELEMPLKASGRMDPAHPAIRTADKRDLPELEQMARQLHTNTRFFKDSKFPRDRAAELYAEWIRVSCEKPSGTVLIATTPSGALGGYIACELDAATGNGQIGLVAVAESSRGQGLGRALGNAGLRWMAGRGASVVSVVTQADNLAALKLYTTMGFSVARVATWFHRWSR